MKKMALLALVGALVVAFVAGTAVAKPGSGNSGSGSGNSGSSSDNSGKKKVTYNFFGTVTAVTPAGTVDPVTGVATTSDTVTVDVKKGNRAARDFVKANGSSQTFVVDSDTKIEVSNSGSGNESEDATLADVVVGDEVKVQVKAPPTAVALLTARQLQVKNEDNS